MFVFIRRLGSMEFAFHYYMSEVVEEVAPLWYDVGSMVELTNGRFQCLVICLSEAEYTTEIVDPIFCFEGW